MSSYFKLYCTCADSPVKGTLLTSNKPAKRPRAQDRTRSVGGMHKRRADHGSSKWSQHVTATSDAMDLARDVFKSRSAATIARSVRRSAETSNRRKSDPFRSAMSMINFYINRAGKNLSASGRRTLEASKGALRKLFHRPAPKHADR